MDIDGDIRVWTDGDKACASLRANGPEGPIVVQASAPLAPIRKRLVRALARRGVSISGTEPGYGATVESIARKKALKRLRKMAPSAFGKRGIASYVARRELAKRRRRRKALARAGQPVGAKAIGPIPPAAPAPKRQRRRRRLGRWVKPLVPATMVATTAALTPMVAKALARRTSPASPAAQPPGGASPGATAEESAPPEAEEQYEDENQDTNPAESSQVDESDEPADDGDMDEGDAEGDEGDEDDGDEGGDEAEVGAVPTPRVTRRHVRQAMVLLHAARRHPRARRRLRQIVQRAGVGEPGAKKALKALKVAKHIKAKKAPAAKVVPPPPAQPPKALVLAQPSSGPSTMPAPSSISTVRRWLDVFAPWRRGVG